MFKSELNLVVNQKNILGESPLWSSFNNGIYWVDIKSKKLFFYSSFSGLESWQFNKMPSAISECVDKNLVIALEDEVIKFDPVNGKKLHITDLDKDRPGNRSNDGKADEYGNLWIGTMQNDPVQKSGRLWKINAAGQKTQILDGIGISNTLAWDTELKRFYFADSMDGVIYKFPINEDESLGAQEIFVKSETEHWVPDGSTIDAEGYLWNAQWDGSRVVRYAPDGQIDCILQVPVKRPTSCTFGGPDMTTLYITSAATHCSDDTLGGALFSIETSVQGLTANLYAG